MAKYSEPSRSPAFALAIFKTISESIRRYFSPGTTFGQRGWAAGAAQPIIPSITIKRIIARSFNRVFM
jgi:hypothetical protein